MNKLLLSVGMANYNHGQYLKKAIDALLNQSIQADEIIIVDDASTDDSVQIIEEMCRKSDRIKLLKNLVNQGCCFSTNRAIEAARGKYVFLTAADDLVLPGFFEKVLDSFEKYPHAGVCVSQLNYIDQAGNVIPQEKLFHRFSPQRDVKIATTCFIQPAELLVRLKRQPWFINGGPSPFYRRQALLETGGWHAELGPYTDWFGVHCAALKYGLIYVPQPLVAFRVNSGGFGETATRNPFTAIEMLGKCLALMRSPEFREVFPASFIRQKENDFAYFALAGSLNGAYRNLRLAADQLMPPSSAIDRALLSVIGFLHLAFKAILLIYCRWKGNKILWSEEA